MDVQKFKEVIRRRKETHDEYDYGVEMCNKEEIQILAEDIPSTIEYLKNDCTADEFVWISEIIDDLAEKTQNRELMECYKSLMGKFPEESKRYHVDFCIECAEDFLEDNDV
ncbi:hypothetical protein [Lactobacillus iners]|jgi:hypothetical protein|uniref:hypothetical protein n=1 Tax=Lactobacillus iners TaxID=147802 RepID=UPI0001E5D643|nr:hypothetical protein [Lactobacillus iners]EFO68443.1 hypothetical protein HMPREF9213_0959 [Lactobacillus iners LactinV 09V1-c]EFO71906.1 hypothetical protein HMPREF9215_0799 [Lactobacillus iners SPIN 2503V10-D]EGC79817.1 hypothetical protein HMPREF0522_0133 [Lactobacillus iners UPII 143-D]MCT7672300.1 hypothetical protein [Lactobacillus iners]MCT7683562.1 hypothetical protein [Lactobacillus iners]